MRFCHFTSWLNRNTLAQTVYMYFYLLNSTKVEDLHLRAFSLSLSKITQHIQRVIMSSKVYAEEDQQTIYSSYSNDHEGAEATLEQRTTLHSTSVPWQPIATPRQW